MILIYIGLIILSLQLVLITIALSMVGSRLDKILKILKDANI